jgi:hypothetical protein
MPETVMAPKRSMIAIADDLVQIFELLESESPEERSAAQQEMERIVSTELAQKVDGVAWFDRRCDQDVAGLQELIAEIESKIGAINRRKLAVRNMAKLAMEKLNATMLKGAVSSISLLDGKDSLIIEDESKLPAEYKTESTVVMVDIDKARLKRDLKTRQIEGARLQTGASYVRIS